MGKGSSFKRILAVTAVTACMAAFGAPAAQAAEAPCSATLPPSLCEQITSTSQFVLETVGRVGPIVNETIDEVFQATDRVYNSVKCTVQGTCPIG